MMPKISQLTTTSTLTGSELFPLVQSGTTKAITLDNLIPLINVKRYGAKGDGVTNDTTAINNAITAANNGGKSLLFPAGTYLYDGGGTLNDGVVVYGEGRNSTKIFSRLASPAGGALLYCSGYGSGVRGLRFDASVTQTAGTYVVLSGIESFCDDFYMNGDFNGILMTGSVSRIRHGRFQDAANNAIRIDVGGGDNSQVIDDVLMGAQNSGLNVAAAGIRLRNCIALMITNTSVIQMGSGLLIDPQNSSQNVLSLFVDTCFFDHCTRPISISPVGTGVVARCKFNNVWAGSGTSDGILLAGSGGGVLNGVEFNNVQAVLNGGSGVSIGTGCVGLDFKGGRISDNLYGMFINNAVDSLRLQNLNFGNYDALGGPNTNNDLVINAACTNVVMTDNLFNSTNKVSGLSNVTNGYVAGNIGCTTAKAGATTIANGASSVVISHGLDRTPTVGNIQVTMNTVPASAADIGWVDPTSITATTFTLKRSGTTGAINYGWRAVATEI